MGEYDGVELIKELKKEFNDSYEYTSEAIEWYISYLVIYGGDWEYKIYNAMNEVFDDLIENKPFCDRVGLIERLIEEKECEDNDR